MHPKLIITAALTGMVPTKSMTPHVPITPAEIAASALACAKLGASIIHIHARENDGSPTWKKEIFTEIIERIREQYKELVLSVTTSGRHWHEFEKRSEVLELKGKRKPDMASLTVGSMNFIHTASVNDPEMIKKLAEKMKKNGIKPELEIFEPGMINTVNYLLKKQILTDKHPYFNILLGSLGTSPLDPFSLATCLHQLPPRAVWSLAGVGDFQLDTNVAALAFGGNVRVGLEDHIYFDRKRKTLATNEMFVERIATIAQNMGISIATPKETRKMLGITSV